MTKRNVLIAGLLAAALALVLTGCINPITDRGGIGGTSVKDGGTEDENGKDGTGGGGPGSFRLYYTNGTSETIDDIQAITPTLTGTLLRIASVDSEGNPTNKLRDGLGNAGNIYIGRDAASGTVYLNFEDNQDGTYTLKHRAAVGGYIPIGTYAEFQLIRKDAATRAETYKQEADLDLLGKTGPAAYGANPDDRNWRPVGNIGPNSFTGTFDGNGKAINNLYISTSTLDAGLFGYVDTAALRSITLASGSITSTGQFIGGIAGAVYGSVIEGCSNAAAVTGGGWVGGIIGDLDGGTSTIRNSSNSGAITATGSKGTVGGIVGGTVWGYPSGSITACYNTGTVTGASYVGGVVGGNFNDITACYNTGTVTGGTYIGGVVGGNASVGIITDCYWLDLSGVDSSSASAAFNVWVYETQTYITSSDTAFGPGSAWPSGGLWDDPEYWGNLGSWNDGDYGRNSTFPKFPGEW